MSDEEGPSDPSVTAAEDQATAVARHLATRVGRHYRELREQRIPRLERLVFTAIWLREFCAPDCDDCE